MCVEHHSSVTISDLQEWRHCVLANAAVTYIYTFRDWYDCAITLEMQSSLRSVHCCSGVHAAGVRTAQSRVLGVSTLAALLSDRTQHVPSCDHPTIIHSDLYWQNSLSGYCELRDACVHFISLGNQWLGLNGILSTQVAAISCLRKFKVY